MHPIERLRHVARVDGAGPSLLVREAAAALAGFADDPAGLVTACRRLVDRHPATGPMWWLAARVLSSDDPGREAWSAADELDDDPTAAVLAANLPSDTTVVVLGWPEQVSEALRRRGDLEVLVVDACGEGSGLVRWLERVGVDAIDVPDAGLGSAVAASRLVLLEASAVGGEGFVAIAGSRAAAAVARHISVPVWVVAGAGRVLPGRLWEVLCRRLEDGGTEAWEREEEVVPLDLADRVVGPAGPVAVDAVARRADCPITPELLKPVGGWSAQRSV